MNPAVLVVLAVVVSIIMMVVHYFNRETKFEQLMDDIFNYVDTLTDLLKAGVDITEEVIQHSVEFAQELGLNVTTEEIQQWVDEYLSFLNIQLAEEEDTGEIPTPEDTNAPSKSDVPNDAPIDDITENDTIDPSDLTEVVK